MKFVDEAALVATMSVGGSARGQRSLGDGVQLPPPPPPPDHRDEDASRQCVGPPGHRKPKDANAVRRRFNHRRMLLASSLLTGWAVAPMANADDHGDDLASATQVALPSETAGAIESFNDADWFQFEVPTHGKVVAVTTTRVVDTVIVLYDASGNELGGADDNYRDHNGTIERTLDAGTYYVRVTSFGNAVAVRSAIDGTTGPYSLYLRLYGITSQNDRHGNDLSTATRVGFPSETAGTIDPGADADWFRFEVPTRGWVVAEAIEVPANNLLLFGSLYDASGNELVHLDRYYSPPGRFSSFAGVAPWDAFTIQRTLDAGTYYIRVVSGGNGPGGFGRELANHTIQGSSPPSGSYRLHLHDGSSHVCECSVAADDGPCCATPLELPSETADSISGGEEDWFRFEVRPTIAGPALRPNGGLVTIEVPRYASVNGRDRLAPYFVAALYYGNPYGAATEECGETGRTGEWGGMCWSSVVGASAIGIGFRIRQGLRAGTYFLRLRQSGRPISENRPYVLRLHGSDISMATQVDLPSETAGAIRSKHYRGGVHTRDYDWFRFDVPSRSTVIAETTGGSPMGVSTIGVLYDASGLALARNFGPRTDFRIERTLDAGTYYVGVGTSSTDRTYGLHLREGADHGNDRATATRVELPSETDGTFVSDDDADWFRFDVPTRSAVIAETAGDLDTVGALYDGDGNRLAFNDDDSDAFGNFRIQRTLDAGAYFVRVVPFWPLSPVSADGQRTTPPASYVDSYVFRLATQGPRPMGTASATSFHLRTLGDFNGDSKDDVLLRHQDGRWRYYPVDGRAVLAGSGAVRLTQDLAWQTAGIGDFDGDRRADVLLRHEDGRWHVYAMDGRRVLAGSGAVRLTQDLAWQTAGIGDFDGDRRADVLLRHEDGRWHVYAMDGRRVLAGSGAVRLTQDLAWQTAGIGDFDGDRRADVLLRHEDGRWHVYAMDGRRVLADSGPARLTTNLAWQTAGIGDFDGDGRADVLLRHEDGRWRYYAMNGHAVRSGGGAVNLTSDTSVAGIGDMNGDGRADILARRADGGWHYYALDGRRLLLASGRMALTGNLLWRALSRGVPPTTGTRLLDRSLTLRQDEAIDLSEAFVDNQLLTYEVRSSDPNVVQASVTAYMLTLVAKAEGMATLTVTARDPDGNSATQTFVVTVGQSDTDSASGDAFRDCAECPLMVRIPAGTFTMGAPSSEHYSHDEERPQRTVSVSAFAAGVYEVTFAEWDACVAAGGCGGYRPDDEGWGRGDRPVINVNWADAQLYVEWVSRRAKSRLSGQRYRLLTESEWEYAARAGTTTPFHTGWVLTPQQANIGGWKLQDAGVRDCCGQLLAAQTVPVGSFAPNHFGLYDMHGNVWELVQDCSDDYAIASPNDGRPVVGGLRKCERLLRGGGALTHPKDARAASRHSSDANNPSGYTRHQHARYNGFRVARML